MKILGWFLAVFVLATAVKTAFDRLGPMAGAYRAYREHAEPIARTKKGDARFRDVEGQVVAVSYRLESAERERDDSVRLVIVESLQFQRGVEMGPMGPRRVASTRQHVVMSRIDGRWVVSELVEDAPELTELGAPRSP